MAYGLFTCTLATFAVGFTPDFGPPSLFPSRTSEGPMVKGDFNGDGKLDVVLTAPGSLQTLLGHGNGSFQQALSSAAREQAFEDMAVADFNGDGRLDVLGLRADFAVIQLGNGDGTFRAPEGQYSAPDEWGGGGNGTHVAAGDVNGDGRMDFVATYIWGWASEDGSGSYGWFATFLNRGDGSFDTAYGPGTGYWTTSIQLVDYDRDGDQDVVVADIEWHAILHDGLGDGRFAEGRGYWIDEHQPLGAVVGDFNGDGAVDLGIGPGYYGHFGFWIGAGDGSFAPASTYSVNGENPTAADFNRDGKLDILSSHRRSPGLNFVHLGDGAFALGGPREFSTDDTTYTRTLVVEDLNGDGFPDVIAAVGQNICVVLNDGVWPAATPAASITDCSVMEGNQGATSAVFTVSLTSASTAPITIDYATENGSATLGEDYIETSGRLTFAPGETSTTITVQVLGDRVPEYGVSFLGEFFDVRLTAADGAVVVDGLGEGRIMDDEPLFAINDVVLPEGRKKQTTAFNFALTLSHAYDQPVTVSYQAADGKATVDSDYAAKSGTVTFAPGQTSKTITINVKGDNRREPNEEFHVNLTASSSNSFFYPHTGTGTILNDD